MTSKIDLKLFQNGIENDFKRQGERLDDFARETDSSGDPLDAATMCGAIVVSCLVNLRAMSHHKLLSRHDIQVAIDAFMDAGRLESKETRMGSDYFSRTKEAA